MKKRTLAALLGTLTALSSVAPTMAQAAENTEEYLSLIHISEPTRH